MSAAAQVPLTGARLSVAAAGPVCQSAHRTERASDNRPRRSSRIVPREVSYGPLCRWFCAAAKRMAYGGFKVIVQA
jgi:hypothetical protein